jgi:hypothetical protein
MMKMLVTIEIGESFYSKSGKEYRVIGRSTTSERWDVQCPSGACRYMDNEEINEIMNSY